MLKLLQSLQMPQECTFKADRQWFNTNDFCHRDRKMEDNMGWLVVHLAIGAPVPSKARSGWN